MSARVLAVANQKGGVGKSTTAVSVAAYLAEWGRRTLLVDIDPQSNATSGLGLPRDADRASIYDVVIDGRPAREAITATAYAGLSLLPADLALAGAELELIHLPRREFRLAYALDDVGDEYDFILVDCPPSLGLLTLNALVAARHLVVPIQCEFYALEGLSHLAYTVDLVRRQSNPALELTGIVMTLFDARTALSGQVVEEVRRMYPAETFETVIPRNVRLSEAPSYGQPISRYEPRSRGGVAYAELTRELLARLEPGAAPDPEGAATMETQPVAGGWAPEPGDG